MALPGQSLTVRDGGIGVVSAAADKPLVVGVTSSGTTDTITTYSNKRTLITALGYGPAVEAACHILDVAGGSVDVLKTAASVAAANSSVTASGGGPAVSVAGTARDFYQATVTVMLGGALGVGRFKYTLDGGQTDSETLVIPAGGSYAIPNTGLTLTFAAGTYVITETYTFTTTPATYNTTNLTAAWAVAAAVNTRWSMVLFTGRAASGATAATNAAAIAGHMLTLENQFRYCRAIVDAGNDTASNVNTAFASFADARVMVVFSRCRVLSSANFAGWGNPLMPFAFAVAGRAAQVRLSTSPAWHGFAGGIGLNRCSAPEFDERLQGETLHNNKIVAPTSVIGYAGTYITNALLKSGAGSDFKYWQWGRVIDLTCQTIHEAQQPYVNSNVRVKLDGTGAIDSRDAARINTKVRNALKAVLLDPVNDQGFKGHVSGFDYAVDETNDVYATGQLQSDCGVVGLAQVERIATNVGFVRQITEPGEEAAA